MPLLTGASIPDFIQMIVLTNTVAGQRSSIVFSERFLVQRQASVRREQMVARLIFLGILETGVYTLACILTPYTIVNSSTLRIDPDL